jgi:hypothetical protein
VSSGDGETWAGPDEGQGPVATISTHACHRRFNHHVYPVRVTTRETYLAEFREKVTYNRIEPSVFIMAKAHPLSSLRPRTAVNRLETDRPLSGSGHLLLVNLNSSTHDGMRQCQPEVGTIATVAPRAREIAHAV